jgi:monoamine oxidase
MSKTPFHAFLQRAFQMAQYSMQQNAPSLEEIVEMTQAEELAAYSRRKFLSQTLKTGAFLGAASILPQWTYASKEGPKVVIVGAGMAGLNAAYQLQKAGITATIYEAGKRAGGRILTRNVLSQGLVSEIGGEYIDSDHKDMLDLAKEFGLELWDTALDDPQGLLQKDTAFIDGRHYGMKDILPELKNIMPRIVKDKNSIDAEYSNPATVALDNTPLKKYLESLGASKWFTKMLDIAYMTEYGLETSEQSALNFVDLIGTSTDKFEIFGKSDERYKIKGGNGQLPQKIAEKLGEQIVYRHTLEIIQSKGSGYELTFQKEDSSFVDVQADFVIFALPFSMLRGVKMTYLKGLSKDKEKCIKELGYGTNAKLIMGFMQRLWRGQGFQGYIFGDEIFNGWDSTIMQTKPDLPGGYTIFAGGEAGAKFNRAHDLALVREYLPKLDKVFPGAKDAHNFYCTVGDWAINPLSKGSYACYKVGQWTSISGLEIEPIKDKIFFAGEHCSDEFQGYMNGAAETGRRAAENIIAILQGKKK